jgi:hypothetical protein
MIGSSQADAQSKHAHEHGKGHLEIAIDQNGARGKLKMPLEALVGFERVPKSEAEQNAIHHLQQKLLKPASLFIVNKEAECNPRVIENKIVRDAGDKHADLDYQFDLNCAKPAAMKQMTITLFADYKRIKEIKVESVGPSGQKSTVAKPQSNLISF